MVRGGCCVLLLLWLCPRVLGSETAPRSALSGLGCCLRTAWDQTSWVLSGAGYEAGVAFRSPGGQAFGPGGLGRDLDVRR